MRRVLICGSRDWTDAERIRDVLICLGNGTVVIHGGCRGADRIADRQARALGYEVIVYPADWQKYGKAAGPKRNGLMLREGKPDEVIAFRNGVTRGTEDMVGRARVLGIRVVEHWAHGGIEVFEARHA